MSKRNIYNMNKFCIFLLMLLLTASVSFSQEGKNKIMKISSEIIEEIELPKGYHEGIFLENNKMFINNGEGIDTWIIDIITGEQTGAIKPISTFTEGIYKKGDKYIVSDWDSKKVYEVEIKDGKMEEIKSVSFKPYRPTGLIGIGELTYVITWERGMGTKYFLNVLDENFELIEKVKLNDISEPSQICWDGEHFLISSWYSKRVYLVAPGTYRTIAYFKAPAKDTTGVFFDGEYYWVTGTYSNLYKMRIEKDMNE